MASGIRIWWRKQQLSRTLGSCDEAGLIRAVEIGNTAAISSLLELGVSVDARDEKGRPALCVAVRQGDTVTTAHLLKLGANLALTDQEGRTAIMEAVIHGDKYLLQHLLEYHPDINKRNALGETALLIAVKEGNTTLGRMLLSAGAEADLADRNGITPLMAAVEDAKVALVKSLLEAGANPEQRDLAGRNTLDRPSLSPRIQKMLQEASSPSPGKSAGTEPMLPDLLHRWLGSATQLLGTEHAALDVTNKGQELIQLLGSTFRLTDLERSEEWLQGGAGMLVLLMQEVQRGLSQLSLSTKEEEAAESWKKLEQLVRGMASGLTAPQANISSGPEQHIHFHLPPINPEGALPPDKALNEAITSGAARAARILSEMRTGESTGELSIHLNEEESPVILKPSAEDPHSPSQA